MEEKEQNLRQFVHGPGLGPGGVHFMWPHGPGSPHSPLSPCRQPQVYPAHLLHCTWAARGRSSWVDGVSTRRAGDAYLTGRASLFYTARVCRMGGQCRCKPRAWSGGKSVQEEDHRSTGQVGGLRPHGRHLENKGESSLLRPPLALCQC